MTERQSREDEGAEQTAMIVAAMKAARIAKHWSARELAEEMTKVGVHWNTDVVVNLEHGRRKSLRVHEAIAAAYVLDLDSPLDLIVPPASVNGAPFYPVTPDMKANADAVRAWFRGQTGPLRWKLEAVRRAATETGLFEDEIEPVVREAAERLELSEAQAAIYRNRMEQLRATDYLAALTAPEQEGGGNGQG